MVDSFQALVTGPSKVYRSLAESREEVTRKEEEVQVTSRKLKLQEDPRRGWMGPTGDIPMVIHGYPWLMLKKCPSPQRVEEFENFERSFIQLLEVL